MRRTILVIGDCMISESKAEFSLGRFMTYKHKLIQRNIGVYFITYNDVVCNRLPGIEAKRVDVMLFFPYNHWNAEIERYDRDSRIYGDNSFGEEYADYLQKINRILKTRYADKDLRFINPPSACILDRDKLKTYRVLKRAGIESPHIYNIKSVAQIDKLVAGGKCLYIKPRFGAMGKGITYLNKKGCFSNFLFKNGRIRNHLYDYNWKVSRIQEKNRKNFLQILIKKGFLVQEAVETPIVKGRKFDLRVYVMRGEVPYLYAKSAPRANFITNWSQGGRIEKRPFINKALGRKKISSVKQIAKDAAKAINLKYAGVDVIFNNDRSIMYVLEIQSFPGYERGFDLMKSLVNLL